MKSPNPEKYPRNSPKRQNRMMSAGRDFRIAWYWAIMGVSAGVDMGGRLKPKRAGGEGEFGNH